MTDDSMKPHVPFIDPNNEQDIRNLAQAFDCNVEQLREAIKVVGTSVAQLREYLRTMRWRH